MFKRETGSDAEDLIDRINALEKLLPRNTLVDHLSAKDQPKLLDQEEVESNASVSVLDSSMFSGNSSEFTAFSSLGTAPSVDVLPTKFLKPSSMVNSIRSRPAFSVKLLQPDFAAVRAGGGSASYSPFSSHESTTSSQNRLNDLLSSDALLQRSLDFEFDSEKDHAAVRIQAAWRKYVDYWFVWGNSGVYQQFAATEFQRIYRGHRTRLYLKWRGVHSFTAWLFLQREFNARFARTMREKREIHKRCTPRAKVMERMLGTRTLCDGVYIPACCSNKNASSRSRILCARNSLVHTHLS